MRHSHSRPSYAEALAQSGVLTRLAAFDPHVAGTPPLGLDLPDSDIDILCHAPDPQAFAVALWESYRDRPGFAMWQWQGSDRPVVARFHCAGWLFELFGQARPVAEQLGWRHFAIERRLLALGGQPLRTVVMARRHAGAKTEPAFAQVLGLAGDPYAALLTLEGLDDDTLRARIGA
ncbi:DUF4269 domain-containing protein [Sphingomonas sp. ABOLE]|uniref:DUF4269 domain-containing protein n=1 Tax=Sphingomonas sp. ABOLE TaxID=1985878 RepID=UPI000F7E27FB|nr:DUF4269 domain-containing protein [Sphingomonas sp. ABOLE]RSV45019.1 DUF4269 domain-containing protein [Sphingomonas sp. ABOLE]